jgi:hypothetical protein
MKGLKWSGDGWKRKILKSEIVEDDFSFGFDFSGLVAFGSGSIFGV